MPSYAAHSRCSSGLGGPPNCRTNGDAAGASSAHHCQQKVSLKTTIGCGYPGFSGKTTIMDEGYDKPIQGPAPRRAAEDSLMLRDS